MNSRTPGLRSLVAVGAVLATLISAPVASAATAGRLSAAASVAEEQFGDVVLNQTSAVHQVTFTASATVTVESAVIGGDVAAFEITADGCTAQTLDAGQSCTVDVVAHPVHVGPTTGSVEFYEPGAIPITSVPLAATGVETAEGGFTSLTPARILDTRYKNGVSTTTKIAPHASVALQVTGRGGVPTSGVMAVVLNVTVVAPAYGGYLTAYPAGQSRPTASSVNVQKGQIIANLVTVAVGSGGKVTIYNGAGATHIVADVSGYYLTDAAAPSVSGDYGSYQPVTPWRPIDTRTADWDATPLASGDYAWTTIDYGPAANAHIRAVAVNVTAVGAKKTGYFTAWDAGGPIPYTSTLNYTPGSVVPNMAIVPVSQYHDPDTGEDIPMIGVYNAGGPVHLLVDVVGIFDDNGFDYGLRFHAMTPKRIVDSRAALGSPKLTPKGTQTIEAPASVAGDTTYALITNTTAVAPTSACYLTVWSADISPRPTVSNLNPARGQTVANMTMTELGSGNLFNVYNSTGFTDLVVDVAGSLDLYPAAVPFAAGAALGRTLDPFSRPRSTHVQGGVSPR